jgi:hypothetical protein
MKNILIISKSRLARDPRVYKQILFLKETKRFRVTSAGTEPSGIEDKFVPLSGPSSVLRYLGHLRSAVQLKTGRYEEYYWSVQWVREAWEQLREGAHRFDLIIANDIPTLPLAHKLARRHDARLYLDAHEYQPLHYDSYLFNLFFRDLWESVCRTYLPTVDYMTTVCQSIADEYMKNFRVQCSVMMNLPFYEEVNPVDRQDGRIRMIHHGLAARHRHMENMIKLMSHLDSRFELDFMLVGMDTQYGRYLKSISGRNGSIRFRPPVGMREIARTISGYDVGLYLLAPGSFNQKMALPNKIFEYIQARLAIAAWPSTEMVRIIDTYGNGVYSEDFEVGQIASILNRLSDQDIMRMKHKSHAAAQELNSERTRTQLLGIVDSLLS